MKSIFNYGKKVLSSGVWKRAEDDVEFMRFVEHSFSAHTNGLWGDLPIDDRIANEEAIKSGEGIILSSWVKHNDNTRILIITDADRRYTTVMFPDER